MLHLIQRIEKVNDDFSIVCKFNSGETRLIPLKKWVEEFRKAGDGWASRLADFDYFKTVKLDSYGTLYWDNQMDFCPDVLYSISKPVN